VLALIACVLLYMVGIAIGYGVFHVQGFRFVWAKRLVPVEQQQSVSFDNLE
jgi:hypothetical protein